MDILEYFKVLSGFNPQMNNEEKKQFTQKFILAWMSFQTNDSQQLNQIKEKVYQEMEKYFDKKTLVSILIENTLGKKDYLKFKEHYLKYHDTMVDNETLIEYLPQIFDKNINSFYRCFYQENEFTKLNKEKQLEVLNFFADFFEEQKPKYSKTLSYISCLTNNYRAYQATIGVQSEEEKILFRFYKKFTPQYIFEEIKDFKITKDNIYHFKDLTSELVRSRDLSYEQLNIIKNIYLQNNQEFNIKKYIATPFLYNKNSLAQTRFYLENENYHVEYFENNQFCSTSNKRKYLLNKCEVLENKMTTYYLSKKFIDIFKENVEQGYFILQHFEKEIKEIFNENLNEIQKEKLNNLEILEFFEAFVAEKSKTSQSMNKLYEQMQTIIILAEKNKLNRFFEKKEINNKSTVIKI